MHRNKKKGTKGLKKKIPRLFQPRDFESLSPAVWTSGFDNDTKTAQPGDCVCLGSFPSALLLVKPALTAAGPSRKRSFFIPCKTCATIQTGKDKHLLQLWQAAGPCWWASWVGQLECCRSCSSSLALEQQCRCLGDELLQGCRTIPTQHWGGRGEVLSWTMETDGVKPVTCIWFTCEAGGSSREHRQQGGGHRRKSLHCSDRAGLRCHEGVCAPSHRCVVQSEWHLLHVVAV